MTALFSWGEQAKAEIAIDLGTANTRVVARGAGVVFDHPTICCFSNDGMRPRLMAVGKAARNMVDRTPANLLVRRPLARGVLQDFEAARELLKFAVTSSIGRRRFANPNAIIGVPEDATKAECIALRQAATDAGLGKIRLVREPFAAALGAGLPIDQPRGSMIVECGAGTTEVAVIASGSVCTTRSVRRGGATLDAAITEYLREHHHFLVGALTAENLKQELVLMPPNAVAGDARYVEIRGRSLETGKPAVLAVPVDAFRSVLMGHASHIVDVVRQVLHETSPELSQDIYEHGITLTGGSADVGCIAQRIASETGVHVDIATDPDRCVTQGLEFLLDA